MIGLYVICFKRRNSRLRPIGHVWNILKKFGVIPKVAMDETEQSSAKKEMNFVISTLLRKFAVLERKLYKKKK